MNFEKLKILALGDCNTLGIQNFKNNSYPERFANYIDTDVINCGFTMSTTNEGVNFFDKNFDNSIDIILIQYGLVDSWETFKFSPYVLYYPDNIFRKIFRKIIKKYKKVCRKMGFNNLFGTKNVVTREKYQSNIEYMINQAKNKKIFLIDTVPNKDVERNFNIKQYNQILDDISEKYDNCIRVKIYDKFEKNLNNYYLDPTHVNEEGYKYLTLELVEAYENCCN